MTARDAAPERSLATDSRSGEINAGRAPTLHRPPCRRPAGPVHASAILDEILWKLIVQREAQRGAS
jgi:hypothetical protein